MPRLEAPENWLYLGKGGCGKSTLVRAQLQGETRVLIHDPNSEPELRDLAGRVCYDRADLVEQMRRPKFVIAWRGYETDPKEAFEFANRVALAAENCLVVMEEIDRFTSAGNLPDHAYSLVHVGRHKGCRVRATARRPHAVPRNLTSNIQRVMAARITEPRDIKFIAETIGEAEAAEGLRTLPDYHFLDWTEENVTVKKSPFS
jgi:hypothetical protein